jgi:hypothetical protein
LTACTILIAVTIEYNFDISKNEVQKPTTTTTTTTPAPVPANSSVNPYSEYNPNEDDKVMEVRPFIKTKQIKELKIENFYKESIIKCVLNYFYLFYFIYLCS